MIDDALVIQARNADLLEYLRANGYRLIHSDIHEYRLEEHDSLVISNNLWHWFSRDTGGNTLDFLMEYEGKEFTDAVSILTGQRFHSYPDSFNSYGYKTYTNHIRTPDCTVPLTLPPKNKDFHRVFAYLNRTRKIDKTIISDMMKQKKLYESDRHNCVFLGTDREGNIRFASERGTITGVSFRRDCLGSDKRFCFHIEGRSDIVFVFEAPLDALSHATLCKMKRQDYTQDHRISLGCLGEAALVQYLEDRPDIRNVVLCLDNDQWGQAASKRFMGMLKDNGYNVWEEVSKKKDYNDDLIETVKRKLEILI